jgi:hypothetical protein
MQPAQTVCSPALRSTWKRYEPAAEIALIVLLGVLLIVKGIIPGWRALNTDFSNYYVVAHLITFHYSLDRIYDWIWFQRTADHFGVNHQLAGFLGLTPFSALPIVPLSWLPVLEAKRVWMIGNVILLAVSLFALGKSTGFSLRRTWLIALFAIIPLRTSLLFGQMHLLVLALLVAAYILHMRGSQTGSGCCIALAAALKVYPIFFCFYFAVKKRWMALAATVVVFLLCLLLSAKIVGPTATKLYLLQQLPRTLQGESGNPFLPALTSSSSLFHRLFLYEPELNPHPLLRSPRLYAFVYSFWQALLAGIVLVRLRRRYVADQRETIEWSMFLVLLMFLSSAPASYQFVVLIAAAVPTMSVLLASRRIGTCLIFFALYFGAANLGTTPSFGSVGISLLSHYLKLWAGIGMLLFYYVLFSPVSAENAQHVKKGFRSPLLTTAALVIILWIPGAVSASLHLAHTPVTANDQLGHPDNAYLRIAPISSRDALLYVAMLRNGYRILRDGTSYSLNLQGDTYTPDQLSFATNRLDGDAWIEEASEGGSRLIHFAAGVPDPGACPISDAESPALSADGSRLAFLREDHGHGSLWMIDRKNCAANQGAVSPVRLTSAAYDVRTLGAGPSGTFLISAIEKGRERIYTVSPQHSMQLLIDDDGAPNSPAVSPSGKLLAMRKLVSGRWQLVLVDLSSGKRTQLTSGDCSAYTPSWKDNNTLLYATDCMRGLGLTTIASLKITP